MPGDKFKAYNDYLVRQGLKSTHQRELVVREFFGKHQHFTIEELLKKVRRKDSRIGYATVYRTLKLLTEGGLAFKREFGGGHSRFEQMTEQHHDHLICLQCGEIVEFENSEIEKLQEKICRRYQFKLVRHKMELYGYCRSCSKKGDGDV